MDYKKLQSCFIPETKTRYVVIEGDPGAGKTTALQVIAGQPGAVVVPELNHLSPGSRGRLKGSPGKWYIQAERERQDEVRCSLRRGCRVFQDRSVLSTLAFACAQSASDGRQAEMLIEEMARIGPFLAPDILFVLHVNTAESMRRRNAFSKDERYKIWFDQAFVARFKDCLTLAVGCLPTRKTIAIDTTHLNPSAVVQKVINLIKFCDPPFREP